MVVTVSATGAGVVYKDGSESSSGTVDVPASDSRSYHVLGKSLYGTRYFDGTIAYLRFWHGVALNQEQVS